MKCNTCGFEQDEGKFCGHCGAPMEEGPNDQTVTAEQPSGQETAVNDTVEKVKQTSKAYGSYFMHYLKKPSAVFTTGAEALTNSLITIALLAVIFSLSFYLLIHNFLSDNFGFYGLYDGPSFLTVFGNGLLFILLITAIIITILFLINKAFATDCSYKEMISIYGTHMVPVTVLSLLGLILILLKSNTYGVGILFLTILFSAVLVPLYLISSLATQKSKHVDALYGYVIYILASIIVFSIVSSILIDSTMGQMVDQLNNFW